MTTYLLIALAIATTALPVAFVLWVILLAVGPETPAEHDPGASP